MDSLRIGVIGIGGMGSHHCRYLAEGQVPRTELTAVCDVAQSRLDWAAGALPERVARFSDAEKLLDSGLVDAVVIATPHYFHPTYGIAAAERGIHVMSEKPAGVYTRQVREMNETVERTGIAYGLMFNQRVRPVHRKLQELVAAGEVGELQRTNWIITNWFRTQAYYDSGGWRATWAGEGGGVLINQCPHNLDLWLWICGLPSRVHAFIGFGKYHDIEVDDEVTAYVEYPNGATGVFITTTGEAPGSNRLEVCGDRGKLVLEDGKLSFQRTRESAREFLRTSPHGFARPETWNIDVPVRSGGEEHKDVTRAWVDHILDGKPMIAPGQEGIRSLELSNAMLLSAWCGETIDIPVDEARFLAELEQRQATSSYRPDQDEAKTMDVQGTF